MKCVEIKIATDNVNKNKIMQQLKEEYNKPNDLSQQIVVQV